MTSGLALPVDRRLILTRHSSISVPYASHEAIGHLCYNYHECSRRSQPEHESRHDRDLARSHFFAVLGEHERSAGPRRYETCIADLTHRQTSMNPLIGHNRDLFGPRFPPMSDGEWTGPSRCLLCLSLLLAEEKLTCGPSAPSTILLAACQPFCHSHSDAGNWSAQLMISTCAKPPSGHLANWASNKAP